ncbi:metal-dependent hydrolase [Cellulomonas soli]|uniref:Metal-dependent hydrolase n=1 Tax=Cellulomonas soli TaxID=931535 RepID=A0A512P8A5_9CELL|nr:metal-dependent hydrolase [Cellulomonas soli]NYI57663.1 membrane-bound metal-dependent hydrolase YbcI (DUF457 family) [Cellulomonas soli]GEP67441.1 metal-dependent hydrolase [Cellulomonas soli]
MGGHHALSGAAAWVAVTSTAPFAFGWHPVSPAGVIAGAFVCAGAALLPDADHGAATVARSLPPVSDLVCAAVEKVSGGHRRGTHSIVGVGLATALAALLGQVTVQTSSGQLAVGAALMSLLLVAFAARVWRLTGDGVVGPWFVAVSASVFVLFAAPDRTDWLPLAVGLGAGVHVLGDLLTTRGVPLLWPWMPRSPAWVRGVPGLRSVWRPSGRLSVPLLGDAGSVREWLLLVPVGVYAGIGVVDACVTGFGIDRPAVEAIVARFVGGSGA